MLQRSQSLSDALPCLALLDQYVKGDESDLGSASTRSIGFVFPQGLKQVVPEMKSDLYRPKRFFGVQFPGPLCVARHREHQVWLGVA